MQIHQLFNSLFRQYSALGIILLCLAVIGCLGFFRLSELQDENSFYSEQLNKQHFILNELNILLLNTKGIPKARELRYIASHIRSVQSSLQASQQLVSLQDSNQILLKSIESLINRQTFQRQVLLDLMEDSLLQLDHAHQQLKQEREYFSQSLKALSLMLPLLVLAIFIFFYYYWHRPLCRRITHFSYADQQSINLLNTRLRQNEKLRNTHVQLMFKLSHIMRVSLNSVLGMLQISDRPWNERIKFLDKAESAAFEMQHAINIMAEYAELEQGTLLVRPRPFCLYSVMATLQEKYQHRLAAKGIEFSLHLNPTVPAGIQQDEFLLVRVLTHLMDNAVENTHSGKICIVIEGDDGATKRLRVQLSDTGVGMSERQLNSIRSGQLKIKQNATELDAHSGLGLITVGRILALMDGEVTFNSRLGQGTCVNVSLPYENAPQRHQNYAFIAAYRQVQIHSKDTLLIQYYRCLFESTSLAFLSDEQTCDPHVTLHLFDEVDQPDENLVQQLAGLWLSSRHPQSNRTFRLPRFATMEQIDAQVQENPYSQFRLKDKKVLIVEDDPINQEVLMSRLKDLELATVIANDGCEALDAVKNSDFDLILMDVSMPRMNGLECTRRLRKDGCETPIIALTGNALRQDEIACLEAGMNGFLSKPLDLEALSQTLQHYL